MFDFKKTQRLLKKIEFDYVFEKSRKIVTSEFIVFFRSNTMSHARLGLALSKKAMAKAHDRNRVKRLIRESFRQNQLPNCDLVFLAKPGLVKQSNSAINTKLSKTWEQLIAIYDR